MILDSAGRERLNNGVSLTERQTAKAMAQPATIGDVNDIAHQHAVKATNNLGNQIPGLVHRIVSQALQGYHDSLILRGIIPNTLPEQNMDHPQNPNPQPQHPHLQGGDTPLVKYVTEAEVEAIVLLVLGHPDTSRFWSRDAQLNQYVGHGENLTTSPNLPLGVAPMAMTDPQSASVPSTDHGIQGTNLGTNG